MKCKCGFEVECELPRYAGYSFGDVMKKSGFFPILNYGGKSAWVCPDCYNKIRDLAGQIYDLCECKHLYLSQILPERCKQK